MTGLDEVCAKIGDELHDAESYANMALEHRADNPELARVLHEISLEEMGHFDRLRAQFTKMADEVRAVQKSFEDD